MKKNDVILIFAVVLAAVLIAFFLNLTKTQGDWVVITSEGEEYMRLPLSEDIQVSVKDKNKIKIENGEVFVYWADCPDKLCVKQGKTKSNIKSIVCLPNQMTIKIEK